MVQFTIQVENEVAATVREQARRQRVPEEQCVSQIVAAHHNESLRFPDGVLREGRVKVVALLEQIPCLGNFESSGVDFRYWWVSFDIDETSPIASRVVRRLAYLLNTESAEMMLPTVFKPKPDADIGCMRWVIESTRPRLDPADVESWLRDQLPQPISDPERWV